MYRRGANEVYNYSIPEKIMNNRHASSPEAYPQLRSPHGSHYDSYGYSMSYSYNQLQHPRDAGYYDPHTLNDLYYPRQRSDSDSSTYIENQMLNQGWSPTGFNDEMDRQYTDADSLHDSYRDGHLDRGATKNTVTNRHANTPIMSSDRLKVKIPCEHKDCLDDYGRPTKYFSRKADVSRHYKSQHDPEYINCPRKNCDRKGHRGFTRQDHLVEHLRGYHNQDIPKRSGSGGNTPTIPRSRHER